MSVRNFAAQLKAEVEQLKSQGTAAINCDHLIRFLEQVENDPEPNPSVRDLERYKAELQQHVDHQRLTFEGNLEMFRSVITVGQGAIKTSFLLNGGAAVAMLAFIGHLAQFSPAKVPEFAATLLPFAHGVLAVAITSGSTYLSQWFYASQWKHGETIGRVLNVLCILLGLASYGLFLRGLYSVFSALSAFS